MTNDDLPFPALFSHSRRIDWGLAVLKGVTDGKSRYLFEDGQERTVATGFESLMLRVETPSPEQHVAFAKLQKALARRVRTAAGASGAADGSDFEDEVTRLKEKYPAGLADPAWLEEFRGEGAEARTRRHRQAAIEEAKAQLSAHALDTLLSGQRFGDVLELLVTLVRGTDLVPAAQLKPRVTAGEPLRELAIALRESLHGAAPYAVRFDRYIASLRTVFATEPRWELATALSGLVQPTEHVVVEPTSFRRQLKVVSVSRRIANKASSADYAICLQVARLTGRKLAEHGEAPRDLFDVRDFIVFTSAPAARPKA